MGGVLKKGFVKPPLTKLLKKIKPEALNRRFTDEELGVIAGQILEWEDKARGLELTEVEIEDIQNDYRKSRMQKAAVMRRWKEKMAFKATLRELIQISRRHI